MVLPNMMAEFGAKSAYIAPDASTLDYLAGRLAKRLARQGEPASAPALREELAANALYPDPGATYAAVYHYQATTLEPTVACPHSVDNVVGVSQVAGVKVQQAFLGTCTNGRLEDIAAAAQVVRGRRVAPGTRFLVIPASSQVLQEALRLGYIETLVEAGAVIGVPGCGPCMGNHMGIPAPGEVTISSANRNFRGRMGTPEAEVYLANPAVVAASAVLGRIADPREVVEPVKG
jgi:homoaconitase/3-isopropylmalate dehydratase large subunit